MKDCEWREPEEVRREEPPVEMELSVVQSDREGDRDEDAESAAAAMLVVKVSVDEVEPHTVNIPYIQVYSLNILCTLCCHGN